MVKVIKVVRGCRTEKYHNRDVLASGYAICMHVNLHARIKSRPDFESETENK